MRKIKHFCFIVLLFSIFILTKRTEAAVQDANDSTLTVQWKDENFGALICKALKKEEVIYADIEGITGISIDSQYTVKLQLDEYAIKSLDLLKNLTSLKSLTIQGAEFSDLQALKNLTNIEKLWLPNNDIENIDALGEMINLEELVLYGNRIKDISALSKLDKLKILKLGGNLIEDVEPLMNLKNLTEVSLRDNPIKNVQVLENLTGTDIKLE